MSKLSALFLTLTLYLLWTPILSIKCKNDNQGCIECDPETGLVCTKCDVGYKQYFKKIKNGKELKPKTLIYQGCQKQQTAAQATCHQYSRTCKICLLAAPVVCVSCYSNFKLRGNKCVEIDSTKTKSQNNKGATGVRRASVRKLEEMVDKNILRMREIYSLMY
jgi:hypothetical protein